MASIRDIVRRERGQQRAAGFDELRGWALGAGEPLWVYIAPPEKRSDAVGLLMRGRAGYRAAWGDRCAVDLTERCL